VVATTSTAALPLTSIYRVGEGDTLDIRILNYEVQSASTLYTVLGGGLLEYPLIGEPLVVSGLTTDDIDARVTAELKRREVFEEPQVVVSVREYLSHTATINGLVENPGVKVMRREALPLYVLLAEACSAP
jgi:protein involved in polysaccharide export with SLBB domain